MAYYITEKCTGCGACAKLCPVLAMAGEAKQRHRVNGRRCVECGVCGRVCPAGAVQDEAGRVCEKRPRAEWPAPHIEKAACSACSICVSVCTAGALRIAPPAFKGDIRVAAELHAPAKCTGCALCRRDCPLGAITMGRREARV